METPFKLLLYVHIFYEKFVVAALHMAYQKGPYYRLSLCVFPPLPCLAILLHI